MKQYVLINGMGEYCYTSTSKTRLVREMNRMGHNDYKGYLESCEYLGDKPELNLSDFVNFTSSDCIELTGEFKLTEKDEMKDINFYGVTYFGEI